mmetsp:Transcript_2156/g.5471  ORF Transcript_2156/g.5471 Transcript_2156/m.5471 type:complete len:518 (-) Transcript_2156:620-2173(-)
MHNHLAPLLVEDELMEDKLDVQQGVDVLPFHGSLYDTSFLVAQHMASLHTPMDEVTPGCHTERHALHVCANLEAIQGGRNALYAELVAGVHGDSQQCVRNDLVGEAADQHLLVLIQIDVLDALNDFQGWPELLAHDSGVVLLDQRVLGRLVNVLEPHEQRWEHHCGVNHVQQADFRELIGLHILHQLHADVLPQRAAIDTVHKLILHNPLRKCLTVDRPVVLHAMLLRELPDQLVRRHGGDSVHHAVGEGAVELNPLLQPIAHLLRALQHRGLHIVAVAGDVVARQHGGAAAAGRAARLQSRHDHAERRGAGELLRVGVHVAPGSLGGVGRRAQQRHVAARGGHGVAKLGDGQAVDLAALAGQGAQHLPRLLGRQQHVLERRHHVHVLLEAQLRVEVVLRVARGGYRLRRVRNDGVHVFLLPQRVPHGLVVRQHTDAHVAPALVLLQVVPQQVVHVRKLVGAEEAAHAKVRDAHLQLGARVGGHLHIGAGVCEAHLGALAGGLCGAVGLAGARFAFL